MSPRVGAVGCGHWGQNIVRDLVALGATVHVADASADGRARAGALGATTVASEALDTDPTWRRVPDAALVAADTEQVRITPLGGTPS